MPKPEIPEATIFMNPDKEFKIDTSEIVKVNAWTNCSVDLTMKPVPTFFLVFTLYSLI